MIRTPEARNLTIPYAISSDDFEMDERVPANLTESRLGISAAELQRFIESGHGNGRTCVKLG
jgi:hypothetical protein